MIHHRWLQWHEGPRLSEFLARTPHEYLDRPLLIDWHKPISDWLVQEDEQGNIRAAAHIVLSRPMAYWEGLAIAPEITGIARTRVLSKMYEIATGLAQRAGCSVARFVTQDEKWVAALQKRGALKAKGTYHVVLQEL